MAKREGNGNLSPARVNPVPIHEFSACVIDDILVQMIRMKE